MNEYTLITGATGGIGREIAKALAAQGKEIILVSRKNKTLEDFKLELIEKFPGRKIRTVICDVSVSQQVRDVLTDLSSEGIRISVLVNCAGIAGGGVTENITDDLWNTVVSTNLNGPFYMTRDILKLGLMPSGGRIINIASTGGKQGVLHGAPYCASKHGIVGFTKSLGLELAKNNSGITVNAVCPGFVETKMAQQVRNHYSSLWGVDEIETKKRIEDRIPIGRYIFPSEVANMVAYLVSPQAAGITAQAINICGGLGSY